MWGCGAGFSGKITNTYKQESEGDTQYMVYIKSEAEENDKHAEGIASA